MKAHGEQKRASVAPYFSHPLEVAAILFFFKFDDATLAVDFFPTRRSSDLVGELAVPSRLALVARVLLGAAQQHARYKRDRKSTRLNSSHTVSSYAVFCWKKKRSSPTKRNRGLAGSLTLIGPFQRLRQAPCG